MELLHVLLVSVLGPGAPDGERRKVYIIVHRPYAHFAGLLRAAFQGHRDVEILVDRRAGERRTRLRLVTGERRRAERRGPRGVQFILVVEIASLPYNAHSSS